MEKPEPTPKDVVRRFLDDGVDAATHRYDMDVIAECFDIDGYYSHTWEANLVETGRRQGAFFRNFTGERELISDDLIAEGDRVVHRVAYRTKVSGSLIGVDAVDRPVEVNHLEMWRVENGKIVEHWGGLGEAHHLYSQLTGE